MRYICTLLFFLFAKSVFSQETLTGYVTDTLNNPLERANVIAMPIKQATSPTFAITDNKGFYKLSLQPKVSYEIRVSYMGFVAQIIQYSSENKIITHNFKLVPSNEVLGEVIINFELPIQQKKDTTTFRVNAFTSGKELKLKEQLEKLPGVEVDNNGRVFFNNRKVSTLLVEDKSFFGGGTKLGVENIPADAVDKVQFIDNYTDIAILKDELKTGELALNVKLKEEKKRFFFGDVNAGYGNQDFYLTHAALFYYSPEFSSSYIGNGNNFGDKVFSSDDISVFRKGISSFVSRRSNSFDLQVLSNENTNMSKNESLLNAMNINVSLNKKTQAAGYIILSDVVTQKNIFNKYHYLQNDVFEIRQNHNDFKNQLMNFNFQFDITPNKNTKLIYNIYSNISENKSNRDIVSIHDGQERRLNFRDKTPLTEFRHYFEHHKVHSPKLKSTLVLNHSYLEKKADDQWFSNKYISNVFDVLQGNSNYNFFKTESLLQHTFDAMYKQYWALPKGRGLYMSLGNNLSSDILKTYDYQLINKKRKDYSLNDLSYLLNDLYINTEYRFNLFAFESKISLAAHFYYLKISQNNNFVRKNYFELEPSLDSEYESRWGKFQFNYRLTNIFPEATQLTENPTLQNFNTMSKGNPFLENAQHHTFSLMQSKSFNKSFIGLMANFTHKNRAFSNDLILNGINQLYSSVQLTTPENSLGVGAWWTGTRVLKNFVSINFRANVFNYSRLVNTEINPVSHRVQSISFLSRSMFSQLHIFKLRYSHGFNQLINKLENYYQTQLFSFSIENQLYKTIRLKGIYQWKNLIRNGNKESSNNLDFSLEYRKEHSPWRIELQAKNVLGNKSIYSSSLSNFLVSEQEINVLPRVVLFSISYKF
ncbi:carboxypeptidase-like regulatory domain-containing protein [Capnocytophaga cynodegmi]|uniref:carboxypeptidase-like regulatory domain-containing protein n=1 Tax=Capnocytophaga cynodegmi TaxID=28189 RepID=UPI00385CD541